MEHDELNHYLRSLEAAECLRSDKIIKVSPSQTTEIVSFVGSNGAAIGPIVRKTFAPDTQSNNAYKILCDAWREGQRFKHLPCIYDHYHSDEGIVVLMEYIRGSTLDEVIDRRGPSLKLARDIAGPLCEAVSELHESMSPPLIHRDLKPSNIIVTKRNLMLIDFGITRQYRSGADRDTTHFGTRDYAPPEQFGFGQTDERSDVYALGMILYRCITGKPPRANLAAEGFPGIDDAPTVKAVLAKATAFDPARRYASAQEFSHAFLSAVHTDDPSLQKAALSRNLQMHQKTTPARTATTKQLDTNMAAPIEKPMVDSKVPADAPRPAVSNESTPRWRDKLGFFQNVCVLTLYFSIAILAIATAISPNGTYASQPLPERLVAYGGLYIVGNGGLAYLLLNKSRLRKRFPVFNRIAGKRGAIICIVLIVSGLLATQAIAG